MFLEKIFLEGFSKNLVLELQIDIIRDVVQSRTQGDGLPITTVLVNLSEFLRLRVSTARVNIEHRAESDRKLTVRQCMTVKRTGTFDITIHLPGAEPIAYFRYFIDHGSYLSIISYLWIRP